VNRPFSRKIRIGGGGAFPNAPYGMAARRREANAARDNHRRLSLRKRSIRPPPAGDSGAALAEE